MSSQADFKLINLSILFPACARLKPKNTEKVLQEYGNRARKLEGQKLDLDDFAQFLDVPVSDMLRDVFALFDEVNPQETFHSKLGYTPFSSIAASHFILTRSYGSGQGLLCCLVTLRHSK